MGLLGGAPAAPAASAFPPITVFDKDGVRIGFAFAKPPGQPAATDITATFTNSGAAPVSGFSLQVSPPSLSLHLNDAAHSVSQDVTRAMELK